MYVIKCPRELTNYVKSKLEERGKIIKESLGSFLYDGPEMEIPEITRSFKVFKMVNAKIEKIKSVIREVKLKDCKFAVRTEKRGNYIKESSLEINRIIGEIILKNSENCKVDLEKPDVVIAIEIFDDVAAICIVKGEEYQYKKYLDKKLILDLMKRTKIAQMVYWGEGAYKMGERIGRAAQAFEIKELIIYTHKKIDGYQFYEFLRGVVLGIKSRLEIQKKIYERKVEKVKLSIYDIYHLILEEKGKSFIIITDPRGKPIKDVKEKIKEAIKEKRNILIVNGSNEGVPVGLFRYADVVVDLAPGITYATEHAIPVALANLIEIYEEM